MAGLMLDCPSEPEWMAIAMQKDRLCSRQHNGCYFRPLLVQERSLTFSESGFKWLTSVGILCGKDDAVLSLPSVDHRQVDRRDFSDRPANHRPLPEPLPAY